MVTVDTVGRVNREPYAADSRRVHAPDENSLMSAHRADHRSTLPVLAAFLLPVVVLPILAVGASVAALTGEPDPGPVASRTVGDVANHDVATTSRVVPRAPVVSRSSSRDLHPVTDANTHRVTTSVQEAKARAKAEERRKAARAAARKAERERIARAKAQAAQQRADERAERRASRAARLVEQAAAQALEVAQPEAGTLRAQVREAMLTYGFGADQWPYLDDLIMRESSWNPLATNASSGAYGLPQSLPGNKMATAGADWRTNPMTQVAWMLDYVKGRYGSPAAAIAHHDTHNWY